MKALSVKQPWAWLIMEGYKGVENRSWRTNYRGPLLIHTGQNMVTKKEYQRAYRLLFEQSKNAIMEMPSYERRNELPTGKLLGLVCIEGVVAMDSSPWFEGEFGWKVSHPERFEPIDYKGNVSLFDVDPEILCEGCIRAYIEDHGYGQEMDLYLRGAMDAITDD